MANTCEWLINVVMANKSKMLYGLEPKGKWSDIGSLHFPIADVAPPAERPDLTHSVIHSQRDKPVALPQGKQTAR